MGSRLEDSRIVAACKKTVGWVAVHTVLWGVWTAAVAGWPGGRLNVLSTCGPALSAFGRMADALLTGNEPRFLSLCCWCFFRKQMFERSGPALKSIRSGQQTSIYLFGPVTSEPWPSAGRQPQRGRLTKILSAGWVAVHTILRGGRTAAVVGWPSGRLR